MSSLRSQVRHILEEEFYNHHYSVIEKVLEKILSLIGKCATPTFSGGEKWNENVETCSNCGIQWKKKGKSCPICFAPTEQKEYCSCPRSWKPGETIPVDSVNPPTCAECHKEIRMGYSRAIYIKPIPAEKKECEHKPDFKDFGWINKCRICRGRLSDEFMRTFIESVRPKPEPKPKERIEELGAISCMKGDYEAISTLGNKINEIIQRINERG